MAVCALTMLEGVEEEVVAAGGALLLALALVLAWLSTHVADRGDHILGTILTVGAHASLIGLGAHESYSGGPNSADPPEQQAAQPSQENKPDDGEPTNERGDDGEGAEDVWTDLRLDIRSKQPQAGTLHSSDGEDDDADEENDDEEEEAKAPEKQPVYSQRTTTTLCASTASSSISVRLKFLNDTEEVAVVEPEDTVGILKSKCFSGREHQVKLIYRGQMLQDPKKTLFSLNITDNSVIHCHISQAVQPPNPEEGAQSGAGGVPGASGGFRATSVAISTSSLVVPVFVVILAVVWYFRINYRQFFTAPATISLVGVTVFFSFLIFGMHSR